MGYPIQTNQIGSTGSTGVFSVDVPGNAQSVLVTARVGTGYLTLDGDTPSATVGHIIPVLGHPIELPVVPGGTIKFLSVTGATGASAALLDLTFIGV